LSRNTRNFSIFYPIFTVQLSHLCEISIASYGILRKFRVDCHGELCALGRVNLHLQAQGVRIATGSIVDATILHAPSSMKNRKQQRDREMHPRCTDAPIHQTRKGKQWCFGMKAQAGGDSKTNLIHTALATAANVAGSMVLPDMLHGEETRVRGDQAYRGQAEVILECAPQPGRVSVVTLETARVANFCPTTWAVEPPCASSVAPTANSGDRLLATGRTASPVVQ
jgi:hypothetical protein